MKSKFKLFGIGSIVAACAGGAWADPVCVFGAGNVGITALACSFDSASNTISVTETFGNAGLGSIQFSGLTSGILYTVRKVITNSSGVNFSRIANELLDPSGQANDSARDPAVQPAFVPAGFSTSNDFDGLSFAQGSVLPRTSSVFGNNLADEFSDSRDFLDFFGGVLANGAVDNFMTFGLTDGGANQPFLLVERPNESSRVPEPGSLLLAASAVVALMRQRRRVVPAAA